MLLHDKNSCRDLNTRTRMRYVHNAVAVTVLALALATPPVWAADWACDYGQINIKDELWNEGNLHLQVRSLRHTRTTSSHRRHSAPLPARSSPMISTSACYQM